MSMVILAFAYDAFVGLQILRTIFTKENVENDTENKDNLIKTAENKQQTAESFNCRLPAFLTQGATGKLFVSGWKFDLINKKVDDQINKQISAIGVILWTIGFSLGAIISQGSSTLSLIVLGYSIISLLTYINHVYVRDFDALTVNFTPLVLTFVMMFAMVSNFNYSTAGMFVGLAADSYFAIRSQPENDKI